MRPRLAGRIMSQAQIMQFRKAEADREWLKNTGLNLEQRGALATLTRLRDSRGDVPNNIDVLSSYFGVTRKRVRRLLAELVAARVIVLRDVSIELPERFS